MRNSITTVSFILIITIYIFCPAVNAQINEQTFQTALKEAARLLQEGENESSFELYLSVFLSSQNQKHQIISLNQMASISETSEQEMANDFYTELIDKTKVYLKTANKDIDQKFYELAEYMSQYAKRRQFETATFADDADKTNKVTDYFQTIHANSDVEKLTQSANTLRNSDNFLGKDYNGMVTEYSAALEEFIHDNIKNGNYETAKTWLPVLDNVTANPNKVFGFNMDIIINQLNNDTMTSIQAEEEIINFIRNKTHKNVNGTRGYYTLVLQAYKQNNSGKAIEYMNQMISEDQNVEDWEILHYYKPALTLIYLMDKNGELINKYNEVFPDIIREVKNEVYKR